MSESTESPQLIDYRGNCHCGAFKFTFKAPAELKQVFGCNCSICSKNGYMWAFPASSDHFAIMKGDENMLKSYEFGKHTMTHEFCPTCGISVMVRMHKADGQSVGINIRALEDVDFDLVKSDDAAGKPLYQAPEPLAVGPVPDGTTVYNGNCHCGAVVYAAFLTPEEITTAKDCNCSICARKGGLWVYPETTRVTFKGLDSLTEYTFNSKMAYHRFCKICGVAMGTRFDERFEMFKGITALNVRTMNGLDLTTLAITKANGKDGCSDFQLGGPASLDQS
ncbi:Mss4-like protein [Mycena epipterygia]|nr:Mss4-like protein [Mycena epipterygia]